MKRKKPSKERGCKGKMNLGNSFDTYLRQAQRVVIKYGKMVGVYKCPHCRGTHITTKIKKSNQYKPLLLIVAPNKENE